MTATRGSGRRAAVCFWGLLNRSVEHTAASIHEHVYAPLVEAGYDVVPFTHAVRVDASTYSNPRAGFERRPHWTLSLEDAVKQLDVNGAMRSEVEDESALDAQLDFASFATHTDPWPEGGGFTFRNHVRALLQLKKITAMWERDTAAHGAFDVVLYVRPDAAVLTPVCAEWLALIQSPEDMVTSRFMSWGGVFDRFAVCGPAAARAWGARFDLALEFSRRHSLHAERFLDYALRAAGVRLHLVPFRCVRVRAGGTFHEYDFTGP